MNVKETEKLANDLERATNVMGNDESMEILVRKTTSMHRTLIQSFFGKFVLPFVRKMALDYSNGYYDLRNEATGKACKLMWDAFCKEHGFTPDVKPRLPLI